MKKQLPLLLALLSFAQVTNAQWSLTGNAGTNPATNFLGTTDSKPLMLRVNNAQAGRIDPVGDNTFLGLSAGLANVYVVMPPAGHDNTGLGTSALRENVSGGWNTAVGASALHECNGCNVNSAFGYGALDAVVGGSANCAFGYSAAGGTRASGNTALGSYSLMYNVGGGEATALGYWAMAYSNNTTDNFTNECVAVGTRALRGSTTPEDNTGNSNTVVGYEALKENSSGSSNVALGTIALTNNTTGGYNCATGRYALTANSTGSYNVANGYAALVSNTTGTYNVAMGVLTLSVNTTGSNNTALGRGANVSSGALSNATALGYNATVSTSNKVRLGNSSVNVVEGQVAYTNPSDARFKREVRTDVKGLDFILQLRPVSYTFDRLAFARHIHEDTKDREAELTELSRKRTVGFLAQEVEKTVTTTGFHDFDAVHAPENEEDNYGLAYAEFVVPLVKAVQELNAENSALKDELTMLRNELDQRLKSLEAGQGKTTGDLHVFPDPANDILQVQVDGGIVGKSAVLEFTDQGGKLVHSVRIAALAPVEQVTLSPEWREGVYMVTLSVKDQTPRTARVVIRH